MRRGVSSRNGQVQPRPALGRRPWFALLRRARNFLRFAFAMGTRLPERQNVPHIAMIECDSGFACPVIVCDSPYARWRGLRPWSCGVGAILKGHHVHGSGLAEPLAVLGLDVSGVVVSRRVLRPRRHVRIPGARFIVEVRLGLPLPRQGEVVRLRPILAMCPDGSSSALHQ